MSSNAHLRLPLLGAIILALCGAVPPAGGAEAQAEDAAALTRSHLEAGTLASGEAELAARLEADPADRTARFGLGLIRFGRAVERLGQGLHRHGLSAPRAIRLPFLRLPVPDNPTPEPLSYADFRSLLQNFLADLGQAEATLAALQPSDAKITLDLNRTALDLDEDGRLTEAERLGSILAHLVMAAPAAANEPFIVSFDHADTLWLRGYCRLLSVLGDFWLAHDFRDMFETTFHLFFPRSVAWRGAPFAARPRSAFDESSTIADAIALVHLMRWPVAEPDRLRRVREHLQAVTALSRENWRAILAETDDDHEWLPGPRQKNSAIEALAVTQERVDAWLDALDEFDAVLDGRKLIAHWRFERGVNLRKVFEEPRTFDLVLWMTGDAAVPYLADGEKVSAQTWAAWERVFGGGFLGYAIWFN